MPLQPMLVPRRVPFLAAFLLTAAVHAQGSGIVISASGAATAGRVHCVDVIAPGVPPGQLHVTVELNGVVMPHTTVRPADGEPLRICVFLPSACAGGELTITVTGAGSSGASSSPVVSDT